MSSRVQIYIGVVCLFLAVTFGAFTLFGTTWNHRSEAAPTPPPATKLTPVVTAAGDIHRGERITARQLGTIRIAGALPKSAFKTQHALVGAIALDDIKEGQMIVRSAVLQDRSARPGLSVLVPKGKRAVALRVNDEVAVGNFVRPDDRVDIELVIPGDQLAKLNGEDVRKGNDPESRILLQSVLVLSVGETLTVDQDNRAIRMQNLTVAVTPKEALLIALAKQVGRFFLALRHPSDDTVVGGEITTARELLGMHTPAPNLSQPAQRIPFILGDETTYQTVR